MRAWPAVVWTEASKGSELPSVYELVWAATISLTHLASASPSGEATLLVKGQGCLLPQTMISLRTGPR